MTCKIHHLNTKFLVFDAKSNIFDTKSFIFNTKFIILLTDEGERQARAERRPGMQLVRRRPESHSGCCVVVGGRGGGAGEWLDDAKAVIDGEGQPEERIEAAGGGEVLRLLPEVPLAQGEGRVAGCLQVIGEGDLGQGQAGG